ncbi:MAG: YbaK/EbsC family protein [Patescibacteria group bacterium]|jgi:Ala-tRNA(Pro) deacylase
MAIPKKLLSYLDKAKIKYKIVRHKTVYTAYDVAQTLGAKLGDIAKTLVIKADKVYLLAVLPASHKLDLGKLKKLVKAKKIEIPKEGIMKKVFKIKPGALSPFGQIYKVPVYIDKGILKAKQVIAGAGTFEESVVMTAKNFIKATGGTLGIFGKKK